VFAVAAIVLAATFARAQTDPLECFKVKNARKKALVNALIQDVAPPQGCKLNGPAQLVCLPPVGDAGDGSSTPFICFEVKCESGGAAPSLAVGDTAVKATRSRLFCIPLPTEDGGDGSTTTTTTPEGCPCPPTTTTTEPNGGTVTPTTVTTSTLLPRPPLPLCESPNTSCGSCGNGACQPTRPEGIFLCMFQTQGFCEGSCESSAECPRGKFCVGASGEFGQCCTPCF
jgi:hypothetical protein